jgi:hypothetical protein
VETGQGVQGAAARDLAPVCAVAAARSSPRDLGGWRGFTPCRSGNARWACGNVASRAFSATRADAGRDPRVVRNLSPREAQCYDVVAFCEVPPTSDGHGQDEGHGETHR